MSMLEAQAQEGTQETKPLSIKLGAFDWTEAKDAAAHVSAFYTEGSEEPTYVGQIVLWLNKGGKKTVPVIIDTQIMSDDLDDVVEQTVNLCMTIAGSVFDAVMVVDVDTGETLDTLSSADYLYECCGGNVCSEGGE